MTVTTSFAKLKALAQLARPYQYVKNAFVLAPLFFSGLLLNVDLIWKSLCAFVIFSIIASAVYAVNDIRDLENDRKHEKKRFRPLPAGTVTVREATVFAIGLFALGFGAAAWLHLGVLALMVFYVLINLGYSFGLKNIAILDVFIVATGFLIRIFVGAAVTGIALSQWIILMTMLLALILALGKRRDDVLIYEKTGTKVRKALEGYNLPFVDASINILAATTMVSYIMYTLDTSAANAASNRSHYLYLTFVFVLMGLFRYFQQLYVFKTSGSPTKLVFKDHFLQIIIVLWVLSFVAVLYLPQI